MCGIFGIISQENIKRNQLEALAIHSKQRGLGASGLMYNHNNICMIKQTESDIMKMVRDKEVLQGNFILGFSQSPFSNIDGNGFSNSGSITCFYDGIILNKEDIKRTLLNTKESDSGADIISACAEQYIKNGIEINDIPEKILSLFQGAISVVIAFSNLGKLLLFSKNGSLYTGNIGGNIYFASEKFPLESIQCDGINQVSEKGLILSIPISQKIEFKEEKKAGFPIILADLQRNKLEAELLQYFKPELKRCTKCILPETMPFITFDSEGVCNYCNNYKPRNKAQPKEELFELLEPYRKNDGPDCIVPFSGGRDSSYSLHLIVNEFNMKPITFSYDWGMITDLGQRNISRMCAELGVENIKIVADINKKRKNIEKNLKAWLKAPNLGMLNILTAGDKHFFKCADIVRKQTGISLNLWGTNPLEVTHFKTGFLGSKPDFAGGKVYKSGIINQAAYQKLRFKAMLRSPGYFNSSLWDTLSGEYYRSIKDKIDYYAVFDYWKWDEKMVDNTLKQYNWELSPDTDTTWRIGDGTAGFYNYVYYTVAGFTEHDTFRSNQIREGQLLREEALRMVISENRPRYENIRWYLDLLNMDFMDVIKTVNKMPKLYEIPK